ncbi:MAG: putative colanic acid biosynthesis acetyltransferase WcaF [Flavobacteriales bacterium]|jgi:putative colanic acid biosynthesis acetyltransferase WcaF
MITPRFKQTKTYLKTMNEAKSTDLSTFNNSWYNPGSPVRRALWYVINVACFLNPLFPFSSLKCHLLRLFGAKVGKGVVIKPRVNIKHPWMLSIGDHTWIGEQAWIDNLGQVTIGKNVCLSQGAMLLCGNHNYKKASFDLIVGAILLEDGVWIGAHSIVCPGVSCAAHSILSVNSVATKNLEALGIYQGNPAQYLRKRNIES